ncbi:alpha/beta hydrolase [Amycolatopsis sp. NPDC049252]|uniref:alpha/beta hydrolase n=1 Tax=Amycolatopsis sp. NPDC049252 TaxID=3363933 RepID=UPI00371AA28E
MLDPQAAEFLRMVAGSPPLDSIPVEVARAAAGDIAQLAGTQPEGVIAKDLTVAEVPVRLHLPSSDPGLPATIYLHGGGWVLGDLDSHHAVAADLARWSRASVVAVDYRRAPEDPFPAALDDVIAVVEELLGNGGKYGLDRTRVAIAGDSAGGNLAAVVAQRFHELVHQALIFPVTDAASVGSTESYRKFGEGHFLTTRDMEFFVNSYAGKTDPSDPRISPLRTPDLAGSPPATVVTAEYDPLRDEGEAYAARLEDAGVPVELRRFDGQVHPFIALGGLIEDANVARRWIGERLAAAFRAH